MVENCAYAAVTILRRKGQRNSGQSRLLFRNPNMPWRTPASLKQSTQLHSHMIITGSLLNPSAAVHLLQHVAHPESGDLAYALKLFSHIPSPSTFLYNTIIRACARFGNPNHSVHIFRVMRLHAVPPDRHTFEFFFKSCGLASSVRDGKTAHGLFVKMFRDSYASLSNSLMHMYIALGCIDAARRVFHEIELKNVVSWTTIVAGLARAGRLDDARKLFGEMPERNVISWTSMVSGCSQSGRAAEAVEFFKKMVSNGVVPDTVAMVAVLSACSQLRDLELSKSIHQYVRDAGIGISSNLAVALIDAYAKCGDMVSASQAFDSTVGHKILPAWNAMIDGYSKKGSLDIARSLFDKMEARDLVTFNSMITGYIQSSRLKEALQLFSKLRASGLQPDKFTMVSLLTACASLGSLDQGKALHAYIVVSDIEFDVFLGTALLDMYAKCGKMGEAMVVFNSMDNRDVLTWTAAISGLAMNGKGKLALEHFALMRKEKIRPNAVAYIGVLTACSHSNLVDEGRKHFQEMISLHKIEPEIEHYGCMVDLLGRAGLLNEAVELIKNMAFEPNAVIWSSLLSSCGVHKNIDIAEKAANNILALEPNEDAVYVQLCNIYSNSGNWASASKIRKLMEERGVKKTAGYSSVTVNGQVHKFIAGDRSHSEIIDIEAMMNEMAKKLKLAGYLPITARVSVDVDEEEKEQALFFHSERMAIAYGLMRLGASLPIHVIKNLRICEDCHSAIKLIAKLWNREIVVRDRSRFHHFNDGHCSCNDFW